MDPVVALLSPPPADARRLRARLARLVRHYARTGSPLAARAVAAHLAALLHSGALRDPEARCACRRLLAHWRCLAAAPAPASR